MRPDLATRPPARVAPSTGDRVTRRGTRRDRTPAYWLTRMLLAIGLRPAVWMLHCSRTHAAFPRPLAAARTLQPKHGSISFWV